MKSEYLYFINAIVDEDDQISDVELLNPYNNKDHCTDKLSILDIKAVDELGRQYNIEMQIRVVQIKVTLSFSIRLIFNRF